MQIAVLGDVLLDIETVGCVDGQCPESNTKIFKGLKANILPGGAGNVSLLLTKQKVTTDLWCDGPGTKDKAWIGDILKQVLRVNRIVWSGEGTIPLKIRAIAGNEVVSRIDAEEFVPHKNGFPALDMLAKDIQRYDAVIVSDYKKGFVNEHTEEAIIKIVKGAQCCVVDSKRRNYALWMGATALVPNLNEALNIYGSDDPEEIRQMVGVKAVYITRGSDSVLMSCGKGIVEISPSEVVDKPYIVGAGDCFTVGVTMALANGMSFLEAGMAGMSLAGKYVTKPRINPLR
jgi:D-beta-D-heptose 7-phosphate kinase/D-beta-D-heptose 1-phosphate adenosyltransferase